jgi:hypothetical protein
LDVLKQDPSNTLDARWWFESLVGLFFGTKHASPANGTDYDGQSGDVEIFFESGFQCGLANVGVLMVRLYQSEG